MMQVFIYLTLRLFVGVCLVLEFRKRILAKNGKLLNLLDNKVDLL